MRRLSRSLIALILGDFVLAIIAHHGALVLRFGSFSIWWGDVKNTGQFKIAVFAGLLVFTSYLAELYTDERKLRASGKLVRILSSLVLCFFILSAFYYIAPQMSLGRGVLGISLVVFGFFQYVWHDNYAGLLRLPGMELPVLILGVGPLAGQVAKTIEQKQCSYRLFGFIQPNGAAPEVPEEKVLGDLEDLVKIARVGKVRKIVVALTERRGVLPVTELIKCRFRGIEVVSSVSFHEELTGTLPLNDVNPDWFIYSNGFDLNRFMRFYKRLLDLLCSGLGLLFSAPLMPIIVFMIKSDSPGPVLFSQIRTGENEKPFKLYKFRTMRPDAEKASGAVWAQENDPRITRIGRLLRKTRLDEIPQLYNVFRGDMAFVGPRPERPEFVEQLKKELPYYSKRHALKPGCTGWAQVKYPYGASVEDALEKLKYDLYYIKNYSLLLDFLIILETVKVVLFSRGSR
ncbi:MAG: TIGR03013 family PEP-CTERM/XrtA system glycosyltransferase [Geopsychrobacter sp.]|nr:TIGR03013 family PEP-CTERM/XrtA system glycosyltransferase [Geopsychrobacter sp.]